jgi:hypothetical protein
VKRLAILAVIAALAAGVFVLRHARAETARRLGAIAGEVAHRDVAVHCQGRVGAALDVGAEAGSVRFDAAGRPADETSLDRSVCESLERFREDGEATFAAVQAIHTLAHESWHLAGIQGEAQTECYALQTTALVAERLGADPVAAQAIAVEALRRLYPALPSGYRTSDCHDGGPLDLRPASSVWP